METRNVPGADSQGKRDAEEAEDLTQQLYRLISNVITASENGLFKGQKYENEIDKAIQKAKVELDQKKYTDAHNSLFKAQRLFDEAWNAASKPWLMCYERGWIHHLFTFLGAGMAMMVLVAIWPLDIFNVDKSAALFGFLGAIVRCIYWTTVQANVRMLRRVWSVQNFFAPIIGLVFGCIADFILKSGFALVSQGNSTPNIYVSSILIFYAGFNWQWILGLLAKASSHVQFNSRGKKKDVK